MLFDSLGAQSEMNMKVSIAPLTNLPAGTGSDW